MEGLGRVRRAVASCAALAATAGAMCVLLAPLGASRWLRLDLWIDVLLAGKPR